MVFAGTLANAALVGANTVNGPAPLSVSVRPALTTRLLSVLNSGFEAMVSATDTGLDWVAQPAKVATTAAAIHTRRLEKMVNIEILLVKDMAKRRRNW